MVERIRHGLNTSHAETAASAEDRRLRGRTYAIPFDHVWRAACVQILTARRWTLLETDDLSGTIEATAVTLVFRFVDDVTLRITLDENAQTRVDMTSRSRKGRGDLGTNARRINAFMRKLDRRLKAKPEQILSAMATVP